MTRTLLPALWTGDWRGTRDALHAYARVAGAIRAQLSPPEKHWYHASLRTSAAGLTTTPIPGIDGTFEIGIDLPNSTWSLVTSTGQHWQTPLVGQSAEQLCAETLNALSLLDIDLEVDAENFGVNDFEDYERAAAARYWQVLCWIDVMFKYFKAGERAETSPVQLWPHHFDLAMLWFSGRRIGVADADDPDSADEQMNFGFVPGDEEIIEPYFYATAWPEPEGIELLELADGAIWHASEGWSGVVLPYDQLRRAADPVHNLLGFLRGFRDAGQRAMAEAAAARGES